MNSSFFSPLREDLDLHSGAPQPDGSPTWIIHDPVTNRFIQIGWLEFEILNRWAKNNIGEIVTSVNCESTLFISADDVITVGNFLSSQQLLQQSSPDGLKHLLLLLEKGKTGLFRKLVTEYLFFRVPLFFPDRFLGNTCWLVRPFFSKLFLYLVLLGAVSGGFLVLRQWDLFIRTTMQLFSIDALLYYLVSLFLVKIMHELGHAYSCKLYGLNVPVIGVAFLVFWPFLYTDTGESWKLTSRKKRLIVGAAGIYVEFVIAVIATLAWSICPPGTLRDITFFIASTSWIITVAININPFMRWDGYYLLSDVTGVNNLQPRANEFAKWRLREWLFGFRDSPPEVLDSKKKNLMIVYAFAVWLYRFFLFLGIALIVYHFIIKVVGIVLAVIELTWFIGVPLKNEICVWYSRRGDMRWNKHSVFSLGLLVILIGLFVLPWKGHILLPAVFKPAALVEIYPPLPGELSKIHFRQNEDVPEQGILYELVSPEIEHKLDLAQTEKRRSELVLKRAQGEVLREERQVATEEYVKAVQKIQGLEEQREKLQIRAPFEGTMVQQPPWIHEGMWIAEKQSLGVVADKTVSVVHAYSRADEMGLLEIGATGYFYPDILEKSRIPVKIGRINKIKTQELVDTILASVNGGPIAIEKNKDAQYIPVSSVFLIEFEPTISDSLLSVIGRGYVRVSCKRRSYATKIWRNFSSLLIREAGF